MKEIDLSDIGLYMKALHCSIRWDIIEALREGPKSSDEILAYLDEKAKNINENMENCKGTCEAKGMKKLNKPSLYYHLRELESVGIIQLEEYVPSEHKRAPKKIWKLNLDKLTINFRI